MRPIKTIAPRRFWNVYRGFHRVMLWLWFGGIGLCLLVAALRLGRFWLGVVLLLMIYPAIIGWLGFNGVGILLTTLPQLRHPQARRQPMEWLLVGALVLLGVTFTAGAVGLLLAILWRMVA